MEKAYADFVTFNQDNIDTFIKTNTAFAKGFEQLTKHVADFASKSFEDVVEAGKKMTACKTVVELVQLQTKLAQESFETIVEEGKTMTDLSTSLAKEISAPITERFKATSATITKVATKKAA